MESYTNSDYANSGTVHQNGHEADTVEVVKGYITQGMAPIPLPFGSKNPNRRNWEQERWTIEDVPHLWNNGQNVGVLCGAPSNGRVDVDCDVLETVRLAPKFLEPTLKGGRDTVPGSHWWYTSPGCPHLEFRDVDGTKLLELRSDGHHTLVYPSIHPDDGDTYRWYTDMARDMTKVATEDLKRQVRLLFTATIIARHMPPIGGRHDYCMALAGFLLRNNRLSEEEARLVMRSAWELFEDATREAFRDIEGTIKTTAERLRKNQKVKGGGALVVFEERLTKAIADGWGWALGSEEAASYSWDEPEELPENLPPVPKFDYRMLPEAFRDWVKDVAERMQVAPDFVGVPLMVTFSSVVGRKVGIRPKRFDDWICVANLWGAIVGRPGFLKSPALIEALAPMDRLIAKAAERHREKLEEYEAEQEIHRARQECYAAEKKKLAKAGDMVALRRFIEENRPDPEDEPELPTERRYRTSDTTTEKLGELLNENPNGLMVFRDELVGFLRSLDRYGRDGDRQFYLETWSGRSVSYPVDRIGRGSLTVESLCLSILGGIQPGRLVAYVHDAVSAQADDDGLLQRFQLVAWPDHDKDWEEVDRYPDKAAKEKITGVFETVDGMEFEAPDDSDIPYLRFDDEAQELFITWRADLEREIRGGDLSPAMEAHRSKYRSLFPSLALLIELADCAAEGEIPQSVGLASAAKALGWCNYLEGHAKRMYSSAERPEMRSARELLKKIKSGEVPHGTPLREIYRHQWTALKDREEARSACEVLQDFGWLRVHKVEDVGRPSEVILLNPKLRTPELRTP